MSKFEAKVYKLSIEPHLNADTLEIARIGDYTSIVKKGSFKTGDLGVYIPEGSLIPSAVLQELGFWKTDRNVGKGMLSGPDGNRVKAIRLRQILSQGVIYRVEKMAVLNKDQSDYLPSVRYFPNNDRNEYHFHVVHEGQDVAEILGITKYEPPIPVHMAGECWNAFGFTLKFDVENIKKFNYILQEGEEIVATEKLHGTFAGYGYHPNAPHDIVFSKGLGAQGLAFKLNENNVSNIYVRNYYKYIKPVFDDIRDMRGLLNRVHMADCTSGDFANFEGKDVASVPLYILGEIFGKGVQDLTYGTSKPSFRVFDIYEGVPGQGSYWSYEAKKWFCDIYKLEMVPLVYRGPYSKEKLLEITTGKETLSGTSNNIREGVVITPIMERNHNDIGRVILKSVSEDYLLRKGKQGEEITEFQ